MFPTPRFASRSSRVIALVTLVAAMSAVDLYFTITAVTSVGMNEMNPLARAIMAYESPAMIALWKAGTVALGCGILLRCRRERSAEFGAWIGFAALAMLMTHWVSFHDELVEIQHDPALVDALGDPTWVRISADEPSHRWETYERYFGRPTITPRRDD